MSLQSEIDEPSWSDILRAVQDQVQDRIHTALPGVVQSYDTATQTATVQLAVQLQGVNVPPLQDCPVAWPGGAAGFLHVPLAKGDTCMVIFAESDYSRWWDTGSVSSPAVLTRHGLHAMVIPGLRRAAAPLAVTGGYVTLGAASEVHLGADSASAAVALAPQVLSAFNQLKSALDIVVGKLNALDPTATGAWNTAMTGWDPDPSATKVKAV